MTLPYVAIVLAVAVTLAGDWFLKHASLHPNWAASTSFYLGIFLYMLSGVGLVIAMRHMPLTSVGAWYAMMTIFAMTALGALVFEEKLTMRDALGLTFAVMAVILMARRI